MKAKRLDIQVGLIMAATALVALALIPGDSVPEIHDDDRLSNFALVEPRPRADDWPWYRGTDRRNVAGKVRLPAQWPASNHNGWQVAVPGRGHATPILWGDQVFLLTADSEVQRISLRCYQRTDGRELWSTELFQGGLPTVQDKNPYASSTPACDGQFVFAASVARGRLWVTSVDLTGRIAWQREAGPYTSKGDYISSPALFKSLVVVVADQKNDSYLTAFHRQTGHIVWRIKRPDGASCGSPVVATISGRPQLIVAGKGTISSYHPGTGETYWTFRWSADRVANTVAFDEEHVYATSRQPQAEVVCIKANGLGDVTDSHLVWRQPKIGGEFPSPILHAGLLYVLSDDGLLRCLEAATGKIEWRRRLAGTFSSSPLIGGDYLICCNETGIAYILQTGTSNTIVAENTLPDGIMAPPVVAGDALLIRSSSHLYRIVPPTTDPIVEKPDRIKRRL